MTVQPPDDPPSAPAPRPPVATLTLANLAVAVGFAIVSAATISPFFKTSFAVILGRTLVLAAVLLAVFIAAQRLPEHRLPGWLPRWLLAVLAVGVAAPLTTLAIYAVTLGGDVAMLFGSMAYLWGFWITAGTALVLGLVVTLTAQLREREAQARSRELQFALERSRLEKQAVDARLALLQAQIEPHFLFNTLANVQALVEAGSPRAAEVLKSLIAYLRAALPRLHDGPATLAQELALVRAYLELMQMRMPDRLQFSIDADPSLQQRPFPPMALLTLVENAVRHGIDPLEQGGRISVGATRAPGQWQLTVSDNGAGLDPRGQPGTGLRNLRERLHGVYGPAARLELEEASPRGLQARIVLPELD
jgi:signal transduction histidine kinase